MSDSSNAEDPNWASTYVRGALRIGMRVPDIEQHLVSRGLSPAEANRLVMNIVEGAFQETSPPVRLGEWGKRMRLLLSTAIGAACVFLAYWFGGGTSVGYVLIWTGPALLSIWIPELSDMSDSDWGFRSILSGWVLLLLCFGYRSFLIFLMFWYKLP